MAQCSFKPQINLTSEVICGSDPKRGTENEEDKLQRLYLRDQKKKQIAKEIAEQKVYGKYNF